jgi:hypothetical protein
MKLHLKTDAKPQLETLQSVRSESTIEGIQKCFCTDIQRFEKDSIETSITHN